MLSALRYASHCARISVRVVGINGSKRAGWMFRNSFPPAPGELHEDHDSPCVVGLLPCSGLMLSRFTSRGKDKKRIAPSRALSGSGPMFCGFLPTMSEPELCAGRGRHALGEGLRRGGEMQVVCNCKLCAVATKCLVQQF